MRVPLGWLQEFFEEPLPETGRLVELLDGLGLAVETIHHESAAPAGVLTARVVGVEPIAGSDHLLRVEALHDEAGPAVQVVCGAPNVRLGMVTALALPGTSLPGLGAVTEREMLSVASRGVLASPRELGVYDFQGGLIALPADTALGLDLAGLWSAETVVELELTPNRGDAFSLLGVARDLGAKLGWRVIHPAAGLDRGDPSRDDGLTIEVFEPGLCPRFTMRAIHGVSIGPSPAWLQRKLAHLGLRPRNNVVDVTNLATFAVGQPSHAYDARVLTGGVIQVRLARAGERLELLNEDEIELDPEDLVIATPEGAADGQTSGRGGEADSRAIGLAGVMGGLHDSVVDDTSEVALEVALFDQVAVRRAARRHKLVTDARTRFERGVDPNLQPLASAYVSHLIQQVAGGSVDDGVSLFGGDTRRPSVAFRPERVSFLMDFEVAPARQRDYLEALGCEVGEETGAGTWSVTPPSWRYDLGLEEDLVEEVARLHGYEHVGLSVPSMFFVPPPTDPTHRTLRQRLAALGLQETVTYVFTSDAELERSGSPAARVRLAAPQGQDRAVLRTSLLPGLLAAAVTNRRTPALAMFEIGRVFLEAEEERLAVLLRGPALQGGWRQDVPTDFFTLKGLLEQLASLAGAELTTRRCEHPQLHPGVAAEVLWQGEVVGYAGRVHPEIEARYEQGELYVAELRLPLVAGAVRFREFSRQPFAERDLAVIAPIGVGYADLERLCAAAAGDKLESLEPFDVYQGSQVPAGNRSVALRLRFRDAARSLTDAEVDDAMANVIEAVRGAGYDIRA